MAVVARGREEAIRAEIFIFYSLGANVIEKLQRTVQRLGVA
jgi:hypothetical protein